MQLFKGTISGTTRKDLTWVFCRRGCPAILVNVEKRGLLDCISSSECRFPSTLNQLQQNTKLVHSCVTKHCSSQHYSHLLLSSCVWMLPPWWTYFTGFHGWAWIDPSETFTNEIVSALTEHYLSSCLGSLGHKKENMYKLLTKAKLFEGCTWGKS